jgi:hypothetical protein
MKTKAFRNKEELSKPMEPTTIKNRIHHHEEQDPLLEDEADTHTGPMEKTVIKNKKGPNYYASLATLFAKYAQITGEGEDGKVTKEDKGYDPKELKLGIKEELEHTDDKAIAEQIAKDHLEEDPKYYSKLVKLFG